MQGLVFIAVTAAGLFVACLNSSIFLAYGVFCAHGERTAPTEKPLARLAIGFIGYGGIAGMTMAWLLITDWTPQRITPYLLGALAAPPSWIAARRLQRATRSPRVAHATMLGGALAAITLLASAIRFDARTLFLALGGASIAWHACVATALLRWSRHTRVHGGRVCLHCGYSLEGLTTPICPECGEHIAQAREKFPPTQRDNDGDGAASPRLNH